MMITDVFEHLDAGEQQEFLDLMDRGSEELALGYLRQKKDLLAGPETPISA